MKKLFLILALVCMSVSASAQEIYNEVKRIEKEVKAFANDTSKDLEARKVATFKYDAIFYLITKGSQEGYRRDAETDGCYRRLGRSLLPLHAAGQSRKRHAL